MSISRGEQQNLVDHMASMLKAYALIGRLVAEARDETGLAAGVCRALVSTRGYRNAWIIILHRDGKVDRWFQAGVGEEFAAILSRFLEGSLTACAQRALESGQIVCVTDPLRECGECPMSGIYEEQAGFSMRLESEGEIFGVLSVSIPRHLAMEARERELFGDLGESVAHGMRRLRQKSLWMSRLRGCCITRGSSPGPMTACPSSTGATSTWWSTPPTSVNSASRVRRSKGARLLNSWARMSSMHA
jgi:hypothetical protein